MWATWIQPLGWKDPLEEDMTTQSSAPAWRSPGQRSLAGHGPWGRKESDTTKHGTFLVCFRILFLWHYFN